MSKMIEAVYENGVFRPLEPVMLPEGEHVRVSLPEVAAEIQRRLAALDAFDTTCDDLTEEQWRLYGEAVQRRPWFGKRQVEL